MDFELLNAAQSAWSSMDKFRNERERCKRFAYGDQWSDLTSDRGQSMREDELLMSQGNLPLKNNLIRRLVRNVLGVYRNRWRLPRCSERDAREAAQARTMQRLLECNSEVNRLEEVYARTMEEFLISGLAIHKKWYGRKGGVSDCQTDIVQPDSFFIDRRGRDIRGGDISLIGEVHDMHGAELLGTFAGSPREAALLRNCYGLTEDECMRHAVHGAERGRCRVYEVWHRQGGGRYLCRDRKSGRVWTEDEPSYKERTGVEAYWHYADEWVCTFLSGEGRVIWEGKSPYMHGGHPYVYKAYPFIDGEIHSFVSDIIDQQKLTNRLISMYDWILRSSAKGVLLFPEGSLPDGVCIDDVAEEWGRFNGVIVYRPRPGVALPQQVSSKQTDVGITELLEIQMKMMEDISGVNGALQGKLDSNSMSGTLYNQQTRNSLSALADIMRSFDDFQLQATAMDASNIRQFYSARRIAAISGNALGLSSELRSTSDFFHSSYDFTLRNEAD